MYGSTFKEWLEYFNQHGMTDEALRTMAQQFNSYPWDIPPAGHLDDVLAWIEARATERGLFA